MVGCGQQTYRWCFVCLGFEILPLGQMCLSLFMILLTYLLHFWDHTLQLILTASFLTLSNRRYIICG
jgi:hypothetical protein